jgi:hypothetical protein
MLCINNYTQEYIDECRAKVNAQLATYRNLVNTARQQTTANDTLNTAIDTFEPVFFNNMVMQLDWLFVHRSRMMEKKDGNPLNEVRVVCESLMNNNSKMIADKTIKLDSDKSVLKYKVDDEIRLNEADFVRLADAFFAEIENKYLFIEEPA